MRRSLHAMLFVLLILGLSQAARAAEWPQFRGPDGQGNAAARDLPLTWSETENVAWKTKLPGKGWSSPVISGNRIWLTTAIDTPADEAEREKRLEANTGSQPLDVAAEVSLRAVCVDLESGKLLHDIELMTEQDPQWVHALNSYASPTPILEGGRLYAHFGSYGTAALDTESGEVLWTNRDLRVMHENGPGSTPVLWGDLLIAHYDGSDEQYVAALHKQSGRLVWKTPRSGEMHENPQLRKAYGTPLVVEVDGRPLLLSTGADWLYAYDPSSGEEAWKINYGVLGFSIVARPVAGHGMLYLSTTYMKPQLLAVELDGKQPRIAWRFTRQVCSIPSPLLVGEQIYFVSDKGIATSLDARTGKELWVKRMGGNFAASPLHADGRIYFFNRDGETKVISPGPEYKQLASNQIEGAFMATPAAIDGALIARTDAGLYRIEKSAANKTSRTSGGE